MSELERVLFKTYTDSQYRRDIQNGTEQLPGLSEEERAAVKALSCAMVDDPSTDNLRCDRR